MSASIQLNPRISRILANCIFGAILFIGLSWYQGCSSSQSTANETSEPDEPQPEADFRAAPLDLNAPFLREPMEEEGEFYFGKGDTFLDAMRLLGATGAASKEIVASLGNRCGFDRIKPGTKLSYKITEGQGIESFNFPCGAYEVLHVRFDENKPVVDIEEIPHQEKERVYVCKVQPNSSLIASAAKVGISDGQVMLLAKVFRSDIDFNNDILPGDELRIWVREIQDDKGQALAPGKILAALFVLQSKEYWGIWYDGPEGKGFFDKKGNSLKKSFLKSPLPFLRVTSGFTIRRFHPILGKFRPHEGVDFGAPTGTPVLAAGDGKVIEAGWAGGYGNCVKIQHSPQLVTLYGHMSKIKVKRGKYIKQGQAIGAVGTTGLSTGPHLHYGMYLNNRAIDPMSVKMDISSAVRSKAFYERRDEAIRLLSSPTIGNKPD